MLSSMLEELERFQNGEVEKADYIHKMKNLISNANGDLGRIFQAMHILNECMIESDTNFIYQDMTTSVLDYFIRAGFVPKDDEDCQMILRQLG